MEPTATTPTAAPRESVSTKNDSSIISLFRGRYFYLIEIVFLLTLALVADQFFFAGDRFWNIEPHPFWMVVLLASVQYGTVPGILAALLSGFALLAGNFPEQTFSEGIYDFLLNSFERPILWFAAAILFGGFRDRHMKEKQTLKENLKRSHEQVDLFTGECQRLEKERKRLETHITGGSSFLLALHQGALDVKAVETEQILDSMLEITQRVMKAEKCSWFVLNNSILEVTDQLGWGMDESYFRLHTALSPLFQEVIGRQRVLCITSPGDEAVLSGEGMLAGALVDAETQKVHGMLKIEKMDFLGLNANSIETFKVLCGWMGSLLGQTSQARDNSMIQDSSLESRLFSKNYFERLTDFLSHLSQQSGFKSHTLIVHPTNALVFDHSLQVRMEKVLKSVVQTHCFHMDLIFEGQKNNCEYIVVLPNTETEDARKLGDAILTALKQELQDLGEAAQFSLTVHSLGEKSEPETSLKS